MHHKQEMEEYIESQLSSEPPVSCDFKVGDKVIFTNYYGVEFELKVIGFSKDNDLFKYGNFIHLNSGAYWFPHKPSELRHI